MLQLGFHSLLLILNFTIYPFFILTFFVFIPDLHQAFPTTFLPL